MRPGLSRREAQQQEAEMFDQHIFRKPSNGSAWREIPFTFSRQNYPRNPSATLAFTLDVQQELTLVIYDSYGHVIHTLYERALVCAGYHELKLYGEVFQANGCIARLETNFGVQQCAVVLNPGR
jgi:hypothetical protein